MHTKGLLSGRKFNGNHTTVISDAKDLLNRIKTLSEVSKISIGRIDPLGAAHRRIKIKPMSACLELKVCGTDGVQYFYVYTKTLDATTQAINQLWEN
jgi:hypothetical protein